MIRGIIEAFRDYQYCAWCGIEKTWTRTLLLHDHCKDCSVYDYDGVTDPRSHGFHTRVGMSER